MRPLAYIMFITNATLSFTNGERKSLKYYDHDCLQNFPLLSMLLLTALIVKSNHILAVIYIIFQKKLPRPT